MPLFKSVEQEIDAIRQDIGLRNQKGGRIEVDHFADRTETTLRTWREFANDAKRTGLVIGIAGGLTAVGGAITGSPETVSAGMTIFGMGATTEVGGIATEQFTSRSLLNRIERFRAGPPGLEEPR